MSNEWSGKTALEILDDLQGMVRDICARPEPLPSLGTIGLTISLEEWERIMWYGWWPEHPPALDMWRIR